MRIVAIGGGENGRTKILPDGTIKQYPFENTPINKKIIELSGKKNPTPCYTCALPAPKNDWQYIN